MDRKEKLAALWKKEKWYWLGAVIIGVMFSLIFGAHWTKGYSAMIQNGISAKVVRFHVLANSDSEADQRLKMQVRDRILQEYGDLLQNCEDKEESLLALEKAQQAICETAAEAVIAAGYDYPVSVSLVREEFPFKRYDDLIFPAGVYDALRVEIGRAEGQNWWCVLYPRMCFVDAAWGCVTEESHLRLKNTLTEEEYLIVSALEQEEAVPKIKLKILEFWQ